MNRRTKEEEQFACGAFAVCSSQITVAAADGLKLKSRAARFADTLNSSDSPKPRSEPLILSRPNVSTYNDVSVF